MGREFIFIESVREILWGDGYKTFNNSLCGYSHVRTRQFTLDTGYIIENFDWNSTTDDWDYEDENLPLGKLG